jgi:hypothetical protein
MKTGVFNKMVVQPQLFILSGLLFLNSGSVFADELGRLFTTPAERRMLEELRYTKPEVPVVEPEIVEIQIEEIIEPEEEKEQAPLLTDTVSVKGVVYRESGKNTAWINDSNTFEGDLESQYIKVKPEGISKENVQIIMPDNTTRIELKVGQSYQPTKEKIIDLVPEREEAGNPDSRQ